MQRQLQAEMGNIEVLEFGATYIRDFTVCQYSTMLCRCLLICHFMHVLSFFWHLGNRRCEMQGNFFFISHLCILQNSTSLSCFVTSLFSCHLRICFEMWLKLTSWGPEKFYGNLWLNQGCLVVKWTIKNPLQWNLNENRNFTFMKIHLKMSTIFSRCAK